MEHWNKIYILKSLTKILNHLDHIKWHRNCAYLWLFCRQSQDLVVPKETEAFRKVFYNFLQILPKKSLGSVLFSRDGWVIANILLFSALLKSIRAELHLYSWWLKCFYSQRKFLGTDRGNILPGNLCIIKTNVRHKRKTIFSIKKYLPIQYMISSCSKNS